MTDEEIMQHQMTLDKLITESISAMLKCGEHSVRQIRPNAQLLISRNKKGQATHIGCYDIQLTLNERHTFEANRQFAPQLIGKRFDYKDSYDNLPKQKIAFEVWLSAFHHLLALKAIE